MAKQYATLLVRDGKDAPWCIHFGDYSRAVVRQELVDVLDAGDYARRNTHIIVTADTQDAINEAVAKLNAQYHG